MSVNLVRNDWVQEHRRNYLDIRYYLGFLVWPFGLTTAALIYRNRPWSKNIFWMFCIFFGLTFVISRDGLDANRYAQTLEYFRQGGMTFNLLLKSFYTPGSNFVDIVQPLITFIASLFTNNPSVLFGIFAAIFGYFYSRNIWYLFSKIEGKLSYVIILYVSTFILLNPIWNINAFRMYTATQVFLYGLLPYLLDGNKKKLWWAISSVLVHFSFVFPVSVIIIYLIFKNRLNTYFLFFIVTTFISKFDIQGVKEVLNSLPDFLQPRVDSYTNAEYIENISAAQQMVNWYVILSKQVLTYIIYSFSIVIFFKFRKRITGSTLNLFNFCLLFHGFINLAILIPNLDRFLIVVNSMMIMFLTIYISQNTDLRIIRDLSKFSIFGILIFIVVTIRMGFDYMSVSTIFGNPLLSLFFNDNYPLIEYVKSVI